MTAIERRINVSECREERRQEIGREKMSENGWKIDERVFSFLVLKLFL